MNMKNDGTFVTALVQWMGTIFISNNPQTMEHISLITRVHSASFSWPFTYVNVGCSGRISDGGVFKNSSKVLNNEVPGIPRTRPPSDFCQEE